MENHSVKITQNRIQAYTFARILLGLIFFWQGFGKVFKWGVNGVYQNFFQPDYGELLPDFTLKLTAYFTSYGELIGGALLIIGLRTRNALTLLGIVLLIVAFGHGLKDPIWDLHHVMYRAILLMALLVMPRAWNRWSIDHFIISKSNHG